MSRLYILAFILAIVSGSILVASGNNVFTGNVIVDPNPDEILIVPINVHLVQDESGRYTSFRDESNVVDLFGEANRIWEPANVHFQIENLDSVELSLNGIPSAINGNYSELTALEEYDDEIIDLFLTQSLNGLNGLALPPISSALVADYTTVNDYRTTAHEFGHLFGLRHVSGDENLMARGRNGETISEEEIRVTRKNVRIWLS